MSNWYYAAQNEQKGPVNEAELKEMLAGGKIPADTLVWKEGMETWTPAPLVPAFFFRPPPLPAKIQPVDVDLSTLPVGIVGVTHAGATVEKIETHPAIYDYDPLDVEKHKVLAILSYVPFLFVLPLIFAKDSAYARFHANQGLILFLAGVGPFIILSILSLYSEMLPFPLSLLVRLLMWGFILGNLGAIIYGILNAVNGKCQQLPIIGHYRLLK